MQPGQPDRVRGSQPSQQDSAVGFRCALRSWLLCCLCTRTDLDQAGRRLGDVRRPQIKLYPLATSLNGKSLQSYTMFPSVKYRGGTMGNLSSALQQLRAERKQAQSHVKKLDQAISVIESLNGSRAVQQANQPTRIISKASRRKMARAQKARWARAREKSQPVVAITKTTVSAPAKRTMSAAARRKIAAFQRARWAKLKTGKKAA